MVSQWPDKDFLKYLSPQRGGKYHLFKSPGSCLNLWGLKTVPASLCAGPSVIKKSINTQSTQYRYTEDKVLIAHPGSRKLHQEQGQLPHFLLTQRWGVIHHEKLKLLMFTASSSCSFLDVQVFD